YGGSKKNSKGPKYRNNTSRTAPGPSSRMPSQMVPNFNYPAMHWGTPQPDFGMNRNFYPGNYNMGYQNSQMQAMMQGRVPATGNAQPQPWAYGGFQTSPYN